MHTTHLSVAFLTIALCACGASQPDAADAAGPGVPVFTIEGEPVHVRDGVDNESRGAVAIVDSARGDLDGDGDDDLAAVLALDSRGSGVFYYLNVLLDEGAGGWRLAGEAFLGDRIDLDSITLDDAASCTEPSAASHKPCLVSVQYMAHGAGQPFAEQPGMSVTRRWRVTRDGLVSVQ